MVTAVDMTSTLAAVSMQAERYRKLCRNYGLPADASWRDVEAAILRKGAHTGFGHAMIAVQEAVTEAIKAEKAAHRNGAAAGTLADW